MPDLKKVRKYVITAIVLLIIGTIFCFSKTIFLHYRYPLRYKNLIEKNAKQFNLDASLVAAVIYEESRFKKDSKSSAGATGLMQLMPETANFIASKLGEAAPKDIADPEFNIRYGSWYLRSLLDQNNNNEKNALASYNAGPSNVATWAKQGSAIQFQETQQFVDRIEKTRKIYKGYYFGE